MAKTEKTQVIPLRLELREAVVNAIAPNSPSPEGQLGKVAASLLEFHALGGVMVRPQELSAINDLTGVRVRVGSDIVKALSGHAPKKDGKMQVLLTVDPSYEAPLNELAETTGTPVEDLVTQAFNYMVAQGWLMQLPTVDVMAVSDDDKAWMEAFMGKKSYSLGEVLSKANDLLLRVGVSEV